MVNAGRESVRATGGTICGRCGAQLPAGEDVCWLCLKPIVGEAEATAGQAPRIRGDALPRTPVASSGGFSLASLMMFMTLTCVVIGLFTIAPGAGFVLGTILVVVWIRTFIVVGQRTEFGLPTTSGEKLRFFFSRLGTTIATLILIGV